MNLNANDIKINANNTIEATLDNLIKSEAIKSEPADKININT